MSESGIESMLDGLSWAEQMELEEQLAEAQGTYGTQYAQARDGCEHISHSYMESGLNRWSLKNSWLKHKVRYVTHRLGMAESI